MDRDFLDLREKHNDLQENIDYQLKEAYMLEKSRGKAQLAQKLAQIHAEKNVFAQIDKLINRLEERRKFQVK